MGMLLRRHRQAAAEAAAEPAAEQDKPLDRQNKTELQASAAQRELSTDGTKAELRERIEAHDAATADGGEPVTFDGQTIPVSDTEGESEQSDQD